MALLVVVQVFEQRSADAVHHAAMHLTFDQHRVEHAAAVMHNHITQDAHTAGGDIDFDFGQMRAIGVAQPLRLEIDRRCQTRCQACRQCESGHAAQGACHLAQRALQLRHALDLDPAILEFQIVLGRLQQGGGSLARLVGHLQRGQMHRIAGRHRLAAGKRSQPQCAGIGVAIAQLNLFRCHAQLRCHQLGQHAARALTLGGGAGGDDDRARGADAYRGALERTASGGLDIVGQADAPVTALGQRGGTPCRKAIPVDQRQRPALTLRIVAAVIAHHRTVALLDRHFERHLCCADQIAATDFIPAYAQLIGHGIEQSLHDKGALRPARATRRRRRHQIGQA